MLTILDCCISVTKLFLRRRYREYAFIGTDEEREQFLYHLLTLTARDFNCFTTAFLSTSEYLPVCVCLCDTYSPLCVCVCVAMTYRVLVVGEGKHFGLSTACLYATLGGGAAEAVTMEMPRGEYQTDIIVSVIYTQYNSIINLYLQSKNLGVLTSLRIGHDNSGITPSLFVEMVLVHNLTTGQTYR